MKTEETVVEGKVQIWAIPRSKYAGDDVPLFSYEIRTYEPYVDGAVMVIEYEIKLVVPAGVDLLMQAIETLEEAKVKLREAYQDRIKVLDEQLANLRLLEYIPTPEEGEEPEPASPEEEETSSTHYYAGKEVNTGESASPETEEVTEPEPAGPEGDDDDTPF